MTAPTPVTRQTPFGLKLEDGHPGRLGCAADPDIALWEMTIKPLSLDNREPINTTTMWNEELVTKSPRQLDDTTDMSGTFAYDPAAKQSIRNLIGVVTTWTFTWPNGDTETFYGYLRITDFAELQEGQMPTVSITITPTNYDPSAGTEEYPVLSATSGTGG